MAGMKAGGVIKKDREAREREAKHMSEFVISALRSSTSFRFFKQTDHFKFANLCNEAPVRIKH